MFQPLNHFNIEMVGGFIHNEQYMLVLKANVDKGFGKGNSFPLSSTQGADILREVMNIQFTEDLFYPGIKIPCACFVHFYKHLTDLVIITCINSSLVIFYHI